MPCLHSFVTIIAERRLAMISIRTRTPWCVSFAASATGHMQNGVVIGGDGFGFAKQGDGTCTRCFRPAPRCLKTMSRYSQTPASTGRTIGERASDAAPKSTTSPSSATAHALAPTPCFAASGARRINEGRQRLHSCRAGRSAGHITIGDRTLITAQSGIPHDLAGNTHYSGTPCVDHRHGSRMRRR